MTSQLVLRAVREDEKRWCFDNLDCLDNALHHCITLSIESLYQEG